MVRPAGGGNEPSGGFSALDFIHISAQEGVGDINGSTLGAVYAERRIARGTVLSEGVESAGGAVRRAIPTG